MKPSLPGKIAASARKLSPYVLTGLLLPGGSIVALLMWLHQRKHKEI